MDGRVFAWAFLLVLSVALLFTHNAQLVQRHFTFRPWNMSAKQIPKGYTFTWVTTPDGENLATAVAIPKRRNPITGRVRPRKWTHISIFFHGNSGHFAKYRQHVRSNLLAGFPVVTFDYRGYGMSSGVPTEKGLYTDAEAVLAWVQKRFRLPTRRIILHGFSLGCAIATQLAFNHKEKPFAALVLEAPFVSFKSAAMHYMPYTAAIHQLIQDDFDNLSKIRHIHKTPLLISHGVNDDVIPFADAMQLFRAANTVCKAFYASRQRWHTGPHLDGRAYRWIHRNMLR